MRKSLLLIAALFAALTAASYAGLHEAPNPPQAAVAPAVPFAAAACCTPAPAVAIVPVAAAHPAIHAADPEIHDAYSDGGYWYWQP